MTSVSKGLTEDEVLVQVNVAIDSLQRRGKLVTQVAVAQLVNISTGRLRKYALVSARLDDIKAARKAELLVEKRGREDALRQRVLDVIEALQKEGRPTTQLSISERLGLSPPTLLYYPSIRAIIEPLEGERWAAIRNRQESKGEMLEAAVLEAMRTLKEDGQVVTQRAIGEIVGMSEGGLHRYPRVRAIMLELVPQTKDDLARQRSVEQRAFVKRVLGIIARMEKRGDRVTYKALEPLSRRTSASLRGYPRIKVAIETSPANPRNRRRGTRAESTQQEAA